MTKKRRQERDRAAVFEAILGDLGEGAPEASEGIGVGAVPVASVRYNDRQPRKHIDEDGLEELAESIREKGVLEPIIVRRAGNGYELVAGERRTRAAALAGLSEVPAIVVDIDDREALEIAIIENLQREDLNAVEETEAVLGLLEITLDLERDDVVALLQAVYNEDRGRPADGRVRERERDVARALFRRLGRFTVSSFVSNRLPILEFPEELLASVRGGRLEFTKAQAIARVENGKAQRILLEEAVRDGLSLSQIRRRITELRREGAQKRTSTGESASVDATTQALVSSTKRLLNKRKIAGLTRAQAARVNELLSELQKVLSEE